MSRPLTIDDLVQALLDAYCWRDAAPVLRDWHATRLRLMAEEFGLPPLIGVFSPRLGGFWGASENWFLRSLLERHAALPGSWWDGFLEYTMRPGEKDIHDRCRPDYEAALVDLKKQSLRAIREFLVFQFPEAAEKTTTHEALVAKGLPASRPQPEDFF